MREQVLDTELVNRLNKNLPVAALNCLDVKWQIDSSYRPRTASGTTRIWFVRDATKKLGQRDFEMLVNDVKWFDTRLEEGGYGAISFVMHVYECSFFSAVLRLRKSGIDQGSEKHLPGPAPEEHPRLFKS